VFYVCDLGIKIYTKFMSLIQVVTIIKHGILLNLKSLF